MNTAYARLASQRGQAFLIQLLSPVHYSALESHLRSTMLKALLKLLSRGKPQTELVLITRRVSEPMETVQGFDENYYCQTCGDYFVLAWHDQSSPIEQGCKVIDGKGNTQVFCPNCDEKYDMYGPILGYCIPNAQARVVEVFHSFEFPFPPDAPASHSGLIVVGDLTIEKIVLMVTGDFPPDMNVQHYSYSVVSYFLGLFGRDLRVSEQGGIRIHILRTSFLSNETSWLTPVLQRHVYKTSNLGNRILLTNGPIELEPPLVQAVVCLVNPSIECEEQSQQFDVTSES